MLGPYWQPVMTYNPYFSYKNPYNSLYFFAYQYG